MIGIIIITHGSLGQSLIACATHVLGVKPEQLAAFSVNTDDDPQQLLPKALALVAQNNTGDGVLIMSDMYGATPCNMASRLLQSGVVEAVAGVNLPMLVRAMTYRHEPMLSLIEKAISGGREGVVYFNNENCERYEQIQNKTFIK